MTTSFIPHESPPSGLNFHGLRPSLIAGNSFRKKPLKNCTQRGQRFSVINDGRSPGKTTPLCGDSWERSLPHSALPPQPLENDAPLRDSRGRTDRTFHRHKIPQKGKWHEKEQTPQAFRGFLCFFVAINFMNGFCSYRPSGLFPTNLRQAV